MSLIINLSDRKSFTILELLVAMAILSVITGTLYTSFKGGTNSWTKGRAVLEMTETARIVLEGMSRELRSVIISPYTDLDSTTAQQDLVFVGQNNGDNDTLDFTAMLRSPDSSEKYKFGVVELGYSHSGTTISRRIDTTALWEAAASADTDPLSGGATDDWGYNISKLNFEYWDPTPITGTTAWDNGTTSKLNWDTRLNAEGSITSGAGETYDDNTLPSAVKISITVTDPTGMESDKEYFIIVFLPGSKVF